MVAKDTAAKLDHLRLQLEDSLSKLQSALKHWQTWEAEYEGLKEEIQELPEDVGERELLGIESDFEGDLVNEKEINELFTLPNGSVRSPKEIIGLLDRRLDYVQKNTNSLDKQLEAAQTRLEHVSAVSATEVWNEEGLPVTEIYEELDENGNVISGSTSRPADAEAQVMKALEKAGVRKQDLAKNRPIEDQGPKQQENDPLGLTAGKEPIKPDLTPTKTAQPPAPTEPKPSKSTTTPSTTSSQTPKSTAQQPSPETQPTTPPPEPSPHLKDLTTHSFPPTTRVVEVNSDDEEISSIGPKTTGPGSTAPESAEDARLRQRMLEYSMREVGEIVAEMNLDERDIDDGDDSEEGEDSGTVEFGEDEVDSGDEDGDDVDGEFDVDVSSGDEEDEHGITRGGLSEAYQKEMRALEERLGMQMFRNVGPDGELAEDSESTQDVSATGGEAARAAQAKLPSISILVHREKSEVKSREEGVRFAKNLDVAPAPSSPASTAAAGNTDATSPPGPEEKQRTPMSDTVIERRPAPVASASEAPAKKVSRFKAARQNIA